MKFTIKLSPKYPFSKEISFDGLKFRLRGSSYSDYVIKAYPSGRYKVFSIKEKDIDIDDGRGERTKERVISKFISGQWVPLEN